MTESEQILSAPERLAEVAKRLGTTPAWVRRRLEEEARITADVRRIRHAAQLGQATERLQRAAAALVELSEVQHAPALPPGSTAEQGWHRGVMDAVHEVAVALGLATADQKPELARLELRDLSRVEVPEPRQAAAPSRAGEVLELLADGPLTLAELAETLRVPVRNATVMVGGHVRYGRVRRLDDGRYELVEPAAAEGGAG